MLILAVVLAVGHYVYENCILPELRAGFRYDLFEYRDLLRKARLHGQISDEAAYRLLQNSLNTGIRTVFSADYLLISEVQIAMRNNRELAEQTKERIRVLDATKDPIIRDLRQGSRKTFVYAVIAGAGISLVYFLPVGFCVLGVARAKEIIKSILVMPEHRSPAFPDGASSSGAGRNPWTPSMTDPHPCTTSSTAARRIAAAMACRFSRPSCCTDQRSASAPTATITKPSMIHR